MVTLPPVSTSGKKLGRELKEASQSKSGGSATAEGRKPVKMVNKISDKLFNNTRYFIMKSNNYDNVLIAKNKVCAMCRNGHVFTSVRSLIVCV